jgi:hypothetical protein
MAVFTHPHAFQNATPTRFRPEWVVFESLHVSPPRLAGSWSADADGRLTWRWRAIGSPARS